MSNTLFDVAIAGGGMVGACLALALNQQGKKVVCIDPVSLESAANDNSSSSFDQRATACAMSSLNLFQALKVWPQLQATAAPIFKIDVSRQGRWGRTRLSAADIQQAAFGAVIPNKSLAAALLAAWQQSPDLQGQWGRRVLAFESQGQALKLSLDNDENIHTRLMVIADGARSSLRQQAGINSATTETGQMALVCNVECEREGNGRAFERFTEHGPLALLPLAARHYNLVWCGSEALTEQRLKMPEAEFAKALNRAFGAGLGRFTHIGKRQQFPLQISAAERLSAERVVVLGNAAQALHPVAGQGFNLGLRDVANLSELLENVTDCGDADLLQQYAANRAHDRAQMLALTTQLASATTIGSSALVGNSFGLLLAGFGQWSAAKQQLALRASGFQQDLPTLCRPHPDSSLMFDKDYCYAS